jgi:hypothetical protein
MPTYSICSWTSGASNISAVYSSARYLYMAVSSTASIASNVAFVTAAHDGRGSMSTKNSKLNEIVASLQVKRESSSS